MDSYVDHKLRDNGSFCCNKLLDRRKDCSKQILFWTSEFIACMKENEIDVVVMIIPLMHSHEDYTRR